jgi:hypothetical protein
MEYNADYHSGDYELEVDRLRSAGFHCWILDEQGRWPKWDKPMADLPVRGTDLLFAKELP